MSCRHDGEREICVSKIYSNVGAVKWNWMIESKGKCCCWMFLMRRNSMRELLQYFGCAFRTYALGVCVRVFSSVLPLFCVTRQALAMCRGVPNYIFSGWLKNIRHSCAKFRINIINIYATRSHSATTFLHYSHFSPINNDDWTVCREHFWPLCVCTQ